MQKTFYFDQTRCTGCFACIVACKDWHDLPPKSSNWIRVTTNEEGEFPNLSVSFLTTICYHCVKPTCASVCPVQAITKRSEDGIVVVDDERCLGRDECGNLCFEACPYDAPQFRGGSNPKMEKCDFCLERWNDGKKPICVAACPVRALDAGSLKDIQAKYGKITEAKGFTYFPKLKPSIIFKPK